MARPIVWAGAGGGRELWRVSVALPLPPLSHACVALKITEKLVAECDSQRLQLIADSYLDMLHAMLESTHTDIQIMATESVSGRGHS